MKSDTIWWIVGGLAAYYLYQNYAAPSATFMTCKYPDGSTIQVPAGNACPYDITHGGQSTPCYAANFVGPIPAGAARC